jgi:2,3-bisphosphoglycerate-independent phosphoglycerate mutase
MNLIFIFLDGVGLGKDDPDVNPLVRASLPNLDALLGGIKLIANGYSSSVVHEIRFIGTRQASLFALDACLGVEGIPQSASGQASLLTGKNVSAMLGFHDGPKPNPLIMDILREGTLFSKISHNNMKAALLNAYPPRYFKSIETGHRLPGVIALSASYAGMHLRTLDDLYRSEAISADFTGQGWHEVLGFTDTPIFTPAQAGEKLNALSADCNLAFFEYWVSDVAGHQQNMQSACDILEVFDSVLGSLVESMQEDRLILITSDHGNLEDLSTRRHTLNDVPLLLIGSPKMREQFIQGLLVSKLSGDKLNLTDISPAILSFLGTLK